MTENFLMNTARDELRQALNAEIKELDFAKLTKQAQSLASEISDGLLYDVQENLADWITDHVRQQATQVVEALLNGNMREAKFYLKIEDQWGREDYGRREWAPKPWFKYQGALHEFAGVELRHAIVDAHKDLITDERIKDLEAQLEGLCKRYSHHDHTGGELTQAKDRLAKMEKDLADMRLAAEKAEAEVDRLHDLTHDAYRILSEDG